MLLSTSVYTQPTCLDADLGFICFDTHHHSFLFIYHNIGCLDTIAYAIDVCIYPSSLYEGLGVVGSREGDRFTCMKPGHRHGCPLVCLIKVYTIISEEKII